MNGDLSHNGRHIYQVGEFQLDTAECSLRRGTEIVPITPKMFGVLSALVQSSGQIVEKDELLRTVWPDSFVEEGNLAVTIRQLRKAFGDDAREPRYIQTVSRRGYRLVAEVRELDSTATAVDSVPPVPAHNRPYILISIAAVLTISILGLAFVWFRGDRMRAAGDRVERLTTSGKVSAATFSQDANLIVYAQRDGVGESLWKTDLTSGEKVQLIPSSAVEYVGLAIPPSADYAYFSMFGGKSADSSFSRVSLNGGEVETLPEIESDVSVSFSPDGQFFAYTESHSGVRETILKVAAADGTNPRTVLTAKSDRRTFPVFRANPVAWSPDGRSIACSVQETDEGSTFFRLILVDPQSGSERYLSDRRWDYIGSIAWKDSETLAITNVGVDSPGGEIFLVSSVTGRVEKLSSSPNEYAWLSGASGKLFAVETIPYSSIFISDFAEGSLQSHPKQIFNQPGSIDDVEWPEPGKIVYNSWASGKNEIWRINPDGTLPSRITNGSRLTFGFEVSRTTGQIVFAAAGKTGSALFISDANGNNVRQLTDGPEDFHPRFTHDGDVIFQRGSLIAPTIWRVPINSTYGPQQLTGYYALQPSISPDGKTVAYQFMDAGTSERVWRIGLVDSSTGRFLNNFEIPYLVTERKTAWHPSGDTLTMVANFGDSLGFLLLSPTDGSYRKVENIATDKISSFVWSPDGKRLAFSTNQSTSDAIVVHGK